MEHSALPRGPAAAPLIARPGLDALLAEATQHPLAVVYAGAGFGKKTAVAQYMTASPQRAVWVSLTPLDNIPAHFWENLTASFRLHRPALAGQMVPLGFPDTPQTFSTFLAELTDPLYQDDLFVVFIFDGLHHITEPAVKQFLASLATARLENSCILFITRQWPALGQALPVAPALVEIEALRFTLAETETLFQVAGAHASAEDLAALHQYVAGWPIALAMLAAALARGDTDAASPSPLAGTKPLLFALFEREIFAQYTPAEQQLLVRLSVLDSFPRGLVQAVSGEKGRELAQLMADNHFIQYDGEARRFYFHPLYHEFLQEKLLSLAHNTVDETYRDAGDWCRTNGHYYDAISYYRQCGCTEGIWQTLLLFPPVRHTKAEADFFIGQIEALPDDFRQAHPMADILLGVMLVNNLRFAEAETALDAVQHRLEAGGAGCESLLGECHIAQGLRLLGMGHNGFEKHFKQAAQLLPAGSSRWNSHLLLIDMGPGLSLHSSKAGTLKKSLACFTEGVPHMVQVLHGAGRGLDHLCACEALFLTGDIKKAAEPAYQALYAANNTSQYDIVGNALFMLLRIYTLLGDYQNVLDTLEHVGRYQKESATAGLGIWDITKSWFYAEMGALDRVPLWIRNAVQNGYPPISVDRSILVRMRCLVAAGQYPEALALIDEFELLARGKNAVITLIYIELCRAVTHHYLGNTGPALRALKAAYHLARGNGIFTPFVEYGHRTRSLLERARNTPGTGIPQDWLEQTHARASTFAKRQAYLADRYWQSREDHQPNFGLSRRETELLLNLSQGLTREETSDSMQLSLNTVKSMTKQVFAKLGAINSADAIRIAMANKLI